MGRWGSRRQIIRRGTDGRPKEEDSDKEYDWQGGTMTIILIFIDSCSVTDFEGF